MINARPDSKQVKKIIRLTKRPHKYIEKVLQTTPNRHPQCGLTFEEWLADLINQANKDDPKEVNGFYMSMEYVYPEGKVAEIPI